MILNKQGPVGVWPSTQSFVHRNMCPVKAKTGPFSWRIRSMLATFSQTMNVRVSVVAAGHLSSAQVFIDNGKDSILFLKLLWRAYS